MDQGIEQLFARQMSHIGGGEQVWSSGKESCIVCWYVGLQRVCLLLIGGVCLDAKAYADSVGAYFIETSAQTSINIQQLFINMGQYTVILFAFHDSRGVIFEISHQIL